MSSKPLKCNKGCGTIIHFDDYHLSKSGKKIPLEEDGEPHQCPNSDYQQQQQQQQKGRSSNIANIDELQAVVDKILEIVTELNNKLIRMESGQRPLEGNE